GFETIYGDQIMQAMRAITNQIESDLATDIYQNASRGYGTAGDTPFASNFNEVAQIRKILVDNGMPTDDRMSTIVMNSAAGVNLRNLANLQSVSDAGNDQLLRQGTLLDLQGMMIKESGQIKTHTAGTAASATTDDTGYAIGSTTITLASAGTGTILAGDLITFAGDTNKYLVTSGDADVSGGGTITLAAPGLRVAIAASATAITVVKDATTLDYTANLGFHKSAIELGVRPMAVPPGGDAASDMMTVQDPNSGIIYQIAAYKGYKKAMFEVSALWGYKVWKPEFTSILVG
ncbi:MAG: P22 phage major capsid protein family protein, partial [Thiomicrorhabdus sp.]|nr:P22 phage major capsid protein family protein [Thiomicrorhabdus sp.]